jgi:predicted glycogen debranching enzyme
MMFKRTNQVIDNYDRLSQLEWLETNGLGGWSGATICGTNTRRYHGLLMAAHPPPAERILLISKLDETIIYNGKRFELGTNNYGDTVYPDGYTFLESFDRYFFPTWIYNTGDVQIQKTITMVSGENTTLIRYKILRAADEFDIEFTPLIAARFYHALQHAENNIFWDIEFADGLFHNQPFAGAPDIYISIPGSTYRSVNKWFLKFNYTEEKSRGLDYVEDLFNHGVFSVKLKEGDEIDIILSTENPDKRNVRELFEKELTRKKLISAGSTGYILKQITLAADQFIVKREIPDQLNKGKDISLITVIAGYHWFTDWSRDTMISLPGLCLATGRFDDAKKILTVFAKSVSQGMLPNRFQDNNEPPEYNNADGTLWYFVAVYYYLQSTHDWHFVLEEILPVLRDIIHWHLNGTRYNIHMDADGLLYAGEKGQQLTWMDARIGDYVVTPRMGKPVEIEALWYNVLKIFENLLVVKGETVEAAIFHDRAEYAKKSFQEKFWNEEGGYLFDNIDENGKPDSSLRSNQLFAISLPHALLEGERANDVFKIVNSKLYTPFGLRSLSPDDPKYCGHYQGDVFARDYAYHQGTVWSWLLGAYIDAGMRIKGESYRRTAMEIVQRFAANLNEGCVGSISEIFDGDEPFLPGGCIAQAWSVAEILRVVKIYNLS